MAFLKSSKVALVPNAGGAVSGAGVMPTADVNGLNFNQFTFTDLAIADINSTNLSLYDTLVLLQICNIGAALSQSQKTDINTWISNGGKLIIYDSDACSGTNTPDYSWLVYPFTTNNPGAQGAIGGTLTIVENNTLSSNVPGDPYYIDTADITNTTDAVGDSNVMITNNANWYGDMQATNVNQVTGWTHTYATSGHGLLIYNGLDTDYINSGGFGGSNINLQSIWLFELMQPWDPDGLPHGIPVVTAIPCSNCTPKSDRSHVVL